MARADVAKLVRWARHTLAGRPFEAVVASARARFIFACAHVRALGLVVRVVVHDRLVEPGRPGGALEHLAITKVAIVALALEVRLEPRAVAVAVAVVIRLWVRPAVVKRNAARRRLRPWPVDDKRLQALVGSRRHRPMGLVRPKDHQRVRVERDPVGVGEIIGARLELLGVRVLGDDGLEVRVVAAEMVVHAQLDDRWPPHSIRSRVRHERGTVGEVERDASRVGEIRANEGNARAVEIGPVHLAVPLGRVPGVNPVDVLLSQVERDPRRVLQVALPDGVRVVFHVEHSVEVVSEEVTVLGAYLARVRDVNVAPARAQVEREAFERGANARHERRDVSDIVDAHELDTLDLMVDVVEAARRKVERAAGRARVRHVLHLFCDVRGRGVNVHAVGAMRVIGSVGAFARVGLLDVERFGGVRVVDAGVREIEVPVDHAAERVLDLNVGLSHRPRAALHACVRAGIEERPVTSAKLVALEARVARTGGRRHVGNAVAVADLPRARPVVCGHVHLPRLHPVAEERGHEVDDGEVTRVALEGDLHRAVRLVVRADAVVAHARAIGKVHPVLDVDLVHGQVLQADQRMADGHVRRVPRQLRRVDSVVADAERTAAVRAARAPDSLLGLHVHGHVVHPLARREVHRGVQRVGEVNRVLVAQHLVEGEGRVRALRRAHAVRIAAARPREVHRYRVFLVDGRVRRHGREVGERAL
mmetsp:Transcript_26944/g.63051  ORF Transcript_26944/g.63051 Transcript_26944/m.63051 type:complete len:705 (+) Transcript_26944:917-3031(+)